MHLLLPSPAERPWAASLDDDALAALYGYPHGVTAERPWVRANFVSTLDGAATGPDGRSGSINTGADREVFALLRALADVVVVGAGTARAEGYRRVVTRAKWRDRRAAAGQTAHPAVAVVSRSARVPPLLAEQRAESGDAYLLTCAAAGTTALAAAGGPWARTTSWSTARSPSTWPPASPTWRVGACRGCSPRAARTC